MKPTFIALFAGALLAALPSTARAELRVVATVSDLAALAREVGGKHVSVKTMSLDTQDPHFVDAKPSLALALNKADLLISVGLDLEIGWLPTLQTGARNRKILTGGEGFLDCSTFITPKDVAATQVDRSQGDIHPSGNPHYFHDPRAAEKVAAGIADRLATLDPDHAGDYAANAKDFAARLAKARETWESRMKTHAGAKVISYHKSFAYLLEWLGIEEAAYLEPKPGVKPSPGHVAKVIALGRRQKIPAVLLESYYPEATAKLAATKMGAKLVKLPGGTKAGQSYIERIEQTVTAIEEALP
jgi:zinc/manganese transport system substrate-binding protein